MGVRAHNSTATRFRTRRSRTPVAVLACLLLVLATLVGADAAAAISRDTIIARGQRWVDLKIPYSQSATFEGYRTDCSGFVSMAWSLPTPGRWTGNLAEVCIPISKDQLQPGDMLLKPGSHAAIFAGWANPERTIWRSLEQSSSNSGAVSRLIPYPFWGDTGYSPYRYRGIGDDYLDVVNPIYGPDRYETAVRSSWAAFPVRGSADTVVLATGESWPDALGGAALAGALDSPLLLTRRDSLPNTVRDEIVRLGARRVIVLGGSAAVSDTVLAAAGAISGRTVERIGGADRYETAADVARMVSAERIAKGADPLEGAYLVTGLDFPDALAVSPAAYVARRPILLTAPAAAPTSTLRAISDLGIRDVLIVGGENAVETTVTVQVGATGASVRRISGSNRYATALALVPHSQELGLRWSALGVAAGTTFPDALAGGVTQGRTRGLMLLTPPDSMNPAVESTIRARRSEIGRTTVYGGHAAVGDVPRARIAHALRGTN
ncbi:MAG: cell wall-binding repeat-containing protein [Coriobacteriia bacterium]|nr:cell wall-binding repeat-containing protein [Coriobacteriia bacterium]